jgi:hypothetical protein
MQETLLHELRECSISWPTIGAAHVRKSVAPASVIQSSLSFALMHIRGLGGDTTVVMGCNFELVLLNDHKCLYLKA